MNTGRLAGRVWLSLFSVAYGLQQLSVRVMAPMSTPLMDLRIFFAAARVAAQGGDPYNPRSLVVTEQRLFPTYAPVHSAQALTLPYMHGPLPLLTLRPFSMWTPAVILVAVLVLIGLLVSSCIALAATWPGQGGGWFVALVAGLPITVQEIALGQLTLVVLAGMTGGILLTRRGHLTAGMVLAVIAASVKPHLGVLAVCAVAASAGWRLNRSLWSGALLGLGALIVGAWWANGREGITSWLAAPFRFGVDGSVVQQLDLLTLPALADILFPSTAAHLAAVLAVLAWGGGMIWLWRRLEGDLEAWLALACVTWLILAPYGHTPDLVLAIPALWWLWRQATQSRWDFVLLVLAYTALWSDAPLHTLLPYGTVGGRLVALPCALALCGVVGVSLHRRATLLTHPDTRSGGCSATRHIPLVPSAIVREQEEVVL